GINNQPMVSRAVPRRLAPGPCPERRPVQPPDEPQGSGTTLLPADRSRRTVRILPPREPTMAKYLYAEAPPARITHYLEIPLGGGSPSPGLTGVFVPKNYKVSGTVDLILYLHGHGANATIDSYWSKGYKYRFHFREGLNESDKNAVLVAPSLGPKSEAGRLMDEGGGADYLDEVMDALGSHGPHTSTPDVGNIVLAAHSGGGVPMRFLARKGFKKYHDNVKECWGFD